MTVAGLVGIVLMYLLMVPSALLLTFTAPQLQPVLTEFQSKILMDSVISAVLLLLALIARSLVVRSDAENLFSFGTERKRIFRAFMIFELILIGPIFFFLEGAVSLFAQSYHVPAGFLPLSTLVLLISGLLISGILISKGTDYAMGIVGILTLADFTNLIGNPVSMGSISTHDYLYSIVAFLALFAALLALAGRTLKRHPFEFALSLGKDSKSVIRHPIDMGGISGDRANFRMWFKIGPYTSRSHQSGTVGKARRLSLTFRLASVVVSSGLISYLLLFILGDQTAYNPLSFLIVYPIGFAVVLYFFASFLPVDSISHERLWISLGSLENRRAIRDHILARASSSALISVPLLIVPAVLYFGHQQAIAGDAFIMALFLCISAFPTVFVSQVISLFVSPEQIMDDTVPQQGIIMKLAELVPHFFLISTAIVGIFFHPFLLLGALALFAVALPFILGTRFLDKAPFSLIRRGFM